MNKMIFASIFVLFSSGIVLAADQSQSGSGAGNSYTCDSKAGTCKCQGYFDCKSMENKVCDANDFMACETGTANCTCVWKDARKVKIRDHRTKAPVSGVVMRPTTGN